MKEAVKRAYGCLYIDPINLLQLLEGRARLLMERIAVPGTDHITTEGLRGRRAELANLIQQLTEITNDH
jgi:hypothetical protein